MGEQGARRVWDIMTRMSLLVVDSALGALERGRPHPWCHHGPALLHPDAQLFHTSAPSDAAAVARRAPDAVDSGAWMTKCVAAPHICNQQHPHACMSCDRLKNGDLPQRLVPDGLKFSTSVSLFPWTSKCVSLGICDRAERSVRSLPGSTTTCNGARADTSTQISCAVTIVTWPSHGPLMELLMAAGCHVCGGWRHKIVRGVMRTWLSGSMATTGLAA